MEARLPPDKLETYTTEVPQISQASETTLRELKSVIEKLQFSTMVIPAGRAFLRRLHNLTIGIKKPHFYLRLTKQVQHDLQMWSTFLRQHNGITILRPPSVVHSTQINLCADSSKTGFGATYGRAWIQGTWPERWKSLHITFLELYQSTFSSTFSHIISRTLMSPFTLTIWGSFKSCKSSHPVAISSCSWFVR